MLLILLIIDDFVDLLIKMSDSAEENNRPKRQLSPGTEENTEVIKKAKQGESQAEVDRIDDNQNPNSNPNPNPNPNLPVTPLE